MKTSLLNRTGCSTFVPLALFTLGMLFSTKGAGPIGVDGGWVVSNNGGINLTPSVAAAYTANGVGWLRIEFRLVNGYTNWNSTMLGYYDQAINNAVAAGLQVDGLIDYTSWPGGQSAWNANNHENTGGNGDNAYVDGFAANAVNPIVAHFHDRIKLWEIWNEPSTWSSHSGSTYSGGTFVYPSVYSWMLTKSWQQVHKVLGYNDCTVISGGIFGTTDLSSSDPNYDYQNSGAYWLNNVFTQGNSTAVNSFLSNRNTYGVYPADGYGQHLYIDYNTQTTTSHVSNYGNLVRNVYTSYDSTSKGTYMTEFGWNTTYVSQSVQAANLTTTFNWCNVGATGAYVKYASWFTWQDGGAGNFGLIDSSGNHKISYGNFGNEAHYEGRTAINNGGQDTRIVNYFNGRGQAILGNPFNNGGSAYVHNWGGAQVQDYNGGSDLHNTVFDSSWGVYHVDDTHGLWTYYQNNGGVGRFGIPTDEDHAVAGGIQQDFAQTTSSPGGTLFWNSSDGSITWTPNQTDLFYTSFETSQTQPTWSDTIDWSTCISGYHSGINPECSTRQEQAHSGTTALMYSGSAGGCGSDYVYFKVFSVNIPITSATKMSYWIYPQQTNGMYVAVDYHCTDGTTLRDSGAVDYNGYSMHPNAGHGGHLPLNAWTDIECNVGLWLAGKTVDKIWVAYDHPNSSGQFRGYIDDIRITNNSIP